MLHIETKKNRHLQRLETALHAATKKLTEAIKRRWPLGSGVSVLLNSRQKMPTRAEVFWVDGPIVRVRLFTTNRRGNRTYKNVHWTRVVGSARGTWASCSES